MQNTSSAPQSDVQSAPHWFDVRQQLPALSCAPPRFIPVRSMSTINVIAAREHPVLSCAAPFPSLPSRRDVQELRAQAEREIERCDADLRVLMNEQKSIDAAPPLSCCGSANGVRMYRGMILSDALLRDVLAANRRKKMESEARVTSGWSAREFRSVQELPQYRRVAAGLRANALPALYHSFVRKEVAAERQRALAGEYAVRRAQWEANNGVLDDYSLRMNSKSSNWPPEFPKDVPAVDDGARLRWAAPDQEMYCREEERRLNGFRNANGYVDDPVGAYREYKERVVWTDDEKSIFVDKYRQYPKKFEKIQDFLPDKSYKEIVEFYYQHKYELGLKENEGLTKKRGGRRKIVSEGTSKKNY